MLAVGYDHFLTVRKWSYPTVDDRTSKRYENFPIVGSVVKSHLEYRNVLDFNYFGTRE